MNTLKQLKRHGKCAFPIGIKNPNILLIRFQIMKKALEHFIRVLLAKLY